MVNIGNSWDEILREDFESDSYSNLRSFLINEYRNEKVFPPMNDIFNALKATDYTDVRAVIIGQDPYHGEGQAHGMAFSVKEGVRIPPSLLNIFKEIEAEYGYPMPKSGYLKKWAEEGVLLLNTILTVREGKPMSHRDKGWEILTDSIIRKLSEREEPTVFFLWGNPARKKKELIDTKRHLVLETVHPSPLSASRGFMGCGHFKKADEFLKAHGRGEIGWNPEN